jgi:O-antigen/teichoic acid export membrane protein
VLPKDQFGIGATLWLIATLLRLLTNLGVDRMLVQADDGDSERVGHVAQTIMLVRGLLCGLALLAIARPTAVLFDCPELTWAFQLVALGPVIDGLRHRDIIRMQRSLRFGPAVAVHILPDLMIACFAYPLARWIGDFRIFLVLAFWRSIASVLASHLFAERRYALAWDSAYALRFVRFGWPLLADGLLLYASLYGDRLLVASFWKMDAMALYAVAVSLTQQPSLMAATLISTLFLPVLSREKANLQRFQSIFRKLTVVVGAMATVFGFGCVFLGPAILRLLYGAKYADAAALVQLLGVAQALRLSRVTANLSAMARGDTQLALMATVVRSAGFFLAIPLVAMTSSLLVIAVAAIGSEAAAATFAFSLLARRHGLPWRSAFQTFGLPAVSLSLCGAAIALGIPTGSPLVCVAGFAVAVFASGVALLVLSDEARLVAGNFGPLGCLGQRLGGQMRSYVARRFL